jgi:HEAT repeat protein
MRKHTLSGQAPCPAVWRILLLGGLGLPAALGGGDAVAIAAQDKQKKSSPDEEAFEALKQKYESEKTLDDFERIETIEGFGAFKLKAASEFLIGLFKTEENPGIQGAIIRALGRIGSRDAVKGIVEQGIPLLTKVKDGVDAFDVYGEYSLKAAFESPRDEAATEWMVLNGLTAAVRAHAGAYRLVLGVIAVSGHPKSESVLSGEVAKANSTAGQLALLRICRGRNVSSGPKIALRLLTAKDQEVQIAALEVLAAHRVADAANRSRYERFLASKQWKLQVLAVDLLSLYRDPKLLGKLTPLLLDSPSKPVKLAVVAALLELGTLDVIPPLIQALDKNAGRVQDDIADALARLTGVDLGPNAAQWESWWGNNKDSAEIRRRSSEEFQALKGAALKEQEGQRTALYHGLRVLSDRCAFLIDSSESMAEPYEPKGEPQADDGDEKGKTVVKKPGKGKDANNNKKSSLQTKLDVAKRELLKVLKQLPDGIQVNVVRFHTEAVGWKPELETLGGAARKDLDGFVNAAKAEGQTNVFDAIETAFADPDVDTVFLLSDGAPTHGRFVLPPEILAEIGHLNRFRKVKINTIGFHLKADERRFLEELSAQNFGIFIAR